MYRRMASSVLCVLVVVVFSRRVQGFGADLIPALQSAECTHYVDNQAGSDGDGSWSSPWSTISDHVEDLGPGDVMCVRGDASDPGRAYHEESIRLDPSEGVTNGTSANPITVRPYLDERVVIYREGSGMLLKFSDINYWHWEGFVFDETGVGPIRFINGASYNVLRDCEVRNGGWAGIFIEDGDENVIQNCHLHGFSEAPGEDAHAILIENGRANVVRANEIHDFTGDGVQLIHGNSSGTLIEDNHIYTTNGHCSENAIDVKSIGGQERTVIRGNVMHGFRETDPSCGGNGSIGPAIILHSDADNILIERNEIYDSNGALRMHKSYGQPDDIEFVNNLVHDLDDSSTAWINGFGLLAIGASGLKFNHNTFINVPGKVVYIDDITDLSLVNNLFYNVGDGIKVGLSGNVVIDYNGWFPSADDELTGPHDMVGLDPRFIDLEGDDYRLHPDGPAVDRGYSIGMSSNDFHGLSRPYGPGYDLGAFETHIPQSVWGIHSVAGQSWGDQITVTLKWSAPGQPGNAGTALVYHLRYDETPITAETWELALPVTVPFSPSLPGTLESLAVTGLPWPEDTLHYVLRFALRTTDGEGNWSYLSNVAFYPGVNVYLPLLLRD